MKLNHRITRSVRRRYMTFRFEGGERGQAIVLIALTLVLLIGMAALAIDGGGLLFLQRDAQNAADAAAFAASQKDCKTIGTSGPVTDPLSELYNDEQAYEAGIAAASQNGFTDGGGQGTARNIDVSIDVSPATLPAGASPSDKPENFVVVNIEADKVSFFSQVVYGGPLHVSVAAVARCSPGSPRTEAKAMVGLGTCAAAVSFNGSSASIGGGVGSNGGCVIGGGGGGNNYEVPPQPYCNTITTNQVTPAVQNTPHPTAPIADPGASLWKVAEWMPGTPIADWATADITCLSGTFPDDDLSDDSCYHHVTTEPDGGDVLEGIYYWDNGINITANGLEVGPRGATLILDGGTELHLNGTFGPASGVAAVMPYRAATAIPSTADDTVKRHLPKNWLLLFSTFDQVGECNSGQEAIQLSLSGTTWNGVWYVPKANCGINMASSQAYGSFICQKVDISGSHFVIDWDPSVLPPEEANISESH